MNSGGPLEPRIRWGPGFPPEERAVLGTPRSAAFDHLLLPLLLLVLVCC